MNWQWKERKVSISHLSFPGQSGPQGDSVHLKAVNLTPVPDKDWCIWFQLNK